MISDHTEEMKKLKKKLVILIAITAVFTVLGLVASKNGFWECLIVGLVAGFMFYIPGRLKGILNIKWLGAIILGILYNALFIFLMEKLGIFATIIYMLVPLADIGYSIFKVANSKKNG